MIYVFGLLMVIIGLLNVLIPEAMLQWHDMFRIRGKREYTAFAIGSTRFSGVVIIIIALVMMISGGSF